MCSLLQNRQNPCKSDFHVDLFKGKKIYSEMNAIKKGFLKYVDYDMCDNAREV